MSSTLTTFFSRLTSTVGLWVLILTCIIVGNEVGYFLLIALMALVGLYEYLHMLEEQGAPVFTLTGMLCAAAYLTGSFLFLRHNDPSRSADLEMGILVAFLFVVFFRQMFRSVAERKPLEAIGYTVFGLFYIPWLFNFITKIIYLAPRTVEGDTTGQIYVVFLLVVTKFSDMGAYVVGSLIGKHPFVPHISPKKTWEGFFGALLFSLLGGFALYYFLPGRLPLFSLTSVLILSPILGAIAVVGDLAESIIKRSALAKDSSHILPGIGGTLDLIDSLLFTAPVLYFYLRFLQG